MGRPPTTDETIVDPRASDRLSPALGKMDLSQSDQTCSFVSGEPPQKTQTRRSLDIQTMIPAGMPLRGHADGSQASALAIIDRSELQPKKKEPPSGGPQQAGYLSSCQSITSSSVKS